MITHDLTRTSGAIILASSLGHEVSLESRAWSNGAFTEELLKAFNGAADVDEDGQIDIDELVRYVMTEVPKITSDDQHPILERDNPHQHFTFASTRYIDLGYSASGKVSASDETTKSDDQIATNSADVGSDSKYQGSAMQLLPLFSIQEEEDMYSIEEPGSQEFVFIRMVSPDSPKIHRIEKRGNLFVVHYFTSAAGTSRFIVHNHAVIFDTRTQTFQE